VWHHRVEVVSPSTSSCPTGTPRGGTGSARCSWSPTRSASPGRGSPAIQA